MNTHELLTEFIRRGGVITLYYSKDQDKPIRFSLRFNEYETSGKTSNLDSLLIDYLEPARDYEDDWAERPDCMP